MYQEKINSLKALGLTDDQIGRLCGQVINVCAIGIGDPTTAGYSRLKDLLPVAVSNNNPLYEVETQDFEDFATHYVSGDYKEIDAI